MSNIPKLTKEQALIITGYTGIICCNFGAFQVDASKRLGESLFTHEFADKKVWEKIKEAYKQDFLGICEKGSKT